MLSPWSPDRETKVFVFGILDRILLSLVSIIIIDVGSHKNTPPLRSSLNPGVDQLCFLLPVLKESLGTEHSAATATTELNSQIQGLEQETTRNQVVFQSFHSLED